MALLPRLIVGIGVGTEKQRQTPGPIGAAVSTTTCREASWAPATAPPWAPRAIRYPERNQCAKLRKIDLGVLYGILVDAAALEGRAMQELRGDPPSRAVGLPP
jgi:hypothetical protein